MRMEVLLGIHGVWDVVDPGLADAKKNIIVKGLLFQSILKDLVLQIGNLKIEKEMWEAIKTRNLRADHVKEAILQTLVIEFKNLKMTDNATIDEYATLGEVMSERKPVKKFLTSLPRWFVHIVVNLEQVLDLKETRGRGRGSYSRGRGRGHGQGSRRGNTQNYGQRNPSKNREDNECPERNRNHEVNINETQEEDVYHKEGTLFMMNLVQDTIFMNEEKYTPPDIESNTEEYDVCPEDARHEQPTTSPEISQDQPTTSQGSSPLHDVNSLKHGQAVSGSNDTPIQVARREIMRLLIALAVEKGWKIRHLDFKTAFLLSDLKELDSTLKEMSFLQYVQEKAVYRKVQPRLELNSSGGNDMKLIGYSDSSHNVDIDEGRSTTRHVFYLGENQRADPLTKALARIRFKEMRSLLDVQELPSSTQKFRG
nr:hypothetical protein [Tanacetum cinerariifolium]